MDIKDTVQHKIYNNVWLFFKKYFDLKQSDADERWEQFIAEADAIIRKYDKCDFVCEMIMAVSNEIERLSKEEARADAVRRV